MTGSIAYHVRQDNFSAEENLVRDGLNQHAAEMADLSRDTFGIMAYDGDAMVGGVTAHVIGRTLNVRLLWVDPAFRGKAIGAKLMTQVEDQAKEMGCQQSFVDTMAYQAPSFYLKQGYQEAGRVARFHDAHDRIFFRKDLV